MSDAAPKKRGRAPMSDDEQRAAYEKRYPGILDMLGVVVDSKIAEKYGCTRAYVQHMRVRLSISTAPKSAPADKRALVVMLDLYDSEGDVVGTVNAQVEFTVPAGLQWSAGRGVVEVVS